MNLIAMRVASTSLAVMAILALFAMALRWVLSQDFLSLQHWLVLGVVVADAVFVVSMSVFMWFLAEDC